MGRWSDYVHVVGDGVREMWTAGAGQHPLYVLGEGFDPRMLVGLKSALGTGALQKPSVLSLGLAKPGSTSARAEKASQNLTQLLELVSAHDLQHERIPCPDVHERRSLSRPLLAALLADELFQSSDHVVIDISALPVGVYFGLIKGLLDVEKKEPSDRELQVVVAENVNIDSRIEGSGADTPAPILGFSFGVDLNQSVARPPLVWAPVLGEGAVPQMEALEESLKPDEICPVLPFPARDPRRADQLIVEAKELLYDRFEIEPTNYIYADERNPFDLYRALSRLQERYRDALQPLGQAAVILSVHSSKSLSLGAMLAAYEHELPAFNAEPEHYDFDLDEITPELVAESELSGAWLQDTPTK